MENNSKYKFDNPRKWLNIQREKRRLNPKCQICGSTEKIQIHHIIPTSHDYSKVYDLSNLVSLCGGYRNCHLYHGHLGNFKNYNINLAPLLTIQNNY